MLKTEVLKYCKEKTGKIFKNKPVFIGDLMVWEGKPGLTGLICLNPSQAPEKENLPLTLKTTDGNFYSFPPDENSEFFQNAKIVANAAQRDVMMAEAIRLGLIEDDGKKTENVSKPKKASAKKETPKVEEPKKELTIWEKINQIRLAWKNIKVEKEGHGKAGGGAKYDYYTPQQIIDFTLEQELKHNLFSNTIISGDNVIYRVMNLEESNERVEVSCPFDIPRKMAASEAQQVGAALTYYTRRLAMLLYKIEDNSKESVEVLKDADYTVNNEPVKIPEPPELPAATEHSAVPETLPETSVKKEKEENIPQSTPKVNTPPGLNSIPPLNYQPTTPPATPKLPQAPASGFGNIEDLYS